MRIEHNHREYLQTRARICKRLRNRGIDSDSLCSLAGRYTSKEGCRTDPPGCESIPGLLKGLQIRAQEAQNPFMHSELGAYTSKT